MEDPHKGLGDVTNHLYSLVSMMHNLSRQNKKKWKVNLLAEEPK